MTNVIPFPEPVRVGDVIHGYAFGYFGRDHYDCGRVEAVGADWIVIRSEDGVVSTASDRDAKAFQAEMRRARDEKCDRCSGDPGY